MKKLILALFFLSAVLSHASVPCKGGDGSGGGKTQILTPAQIKNLVANIDDGVSGGG